MYAVCFYACALSVSSHVSIADALIILAISVVGKTVAPTPGGVIGAEAGIFTGLLAYGIKSLEAILIIVLYRFITYWLPFGIVAIAFGRVNQKQYI